MTFRLYLPRTANSMVYCEFESKSLLILPTSLDLLGLRKRSEGALLLCLLSELSWKTHFLIAKGSSTYREYFTTVFSLISSSYVNEVTPLLEAASFNRSMTTNDIYRLMPITPKEFLFVFLLYCFFTLREERLYFDPLD